MPKVVAFPQQWLAKVQSQCVREAIAEIQSGRVAAALPEICIALAGEAGLALSHRLDHKLGFLQEFVQGSADDRVTLGVQDAVIVFFLRIGTASR
jgi:hypothetical protein